ncbi:hypothetical protein JTE90_019013 [Oedothorax gibbosus]|uniref:PCNA-associated factor histone-like domain-containing protein n=1 Tax=Oedothorax gibbosus TaxID=931172 RepID=A0AAV6V0F8_9ARAC|nr:hypothetical protein JTE90_019013 [Oedothorax gibbosus]
MARTKADAAKKAGGKAPRKEPMLRNSPSSAGVSKSKNCNGAALRNSARKCPVPKWQVSVKDLAWMQPGSSRDPQAQEVNEENGNNHEENGGKSEENGREDEGSELLQQDMEDSNESVDQELDRSESLGRESLDIEISNHDKVDDSKEKV